MTDACMACRRTWPREDHFIADLGLSKAYLHDDQFFPGWTVLVFQRHATELFQLAPTERFPSGAMPESAADAAAMRT